MSLREELEKLRDEYWENDYVKIKPLTTQADLIYAGFDCRLTEEQQELVNPFWFSIGRAYLFRDKDHQGKGYGTQAARLAIQILKAANPNMPIKLATERSNAAAQRLYQSLGFEQLTELDGDDLVFGL